MNQRILLDLVSTWAVLMELIRSQAGTSIVILFPSGSTTVRKACIRSSRRKTFPCYSALWSDAGIG
jgi:hypothetical protein